MLDEPYHHWFDPKNRDIFTTEFNKVNEIQYKLTHYMVDNKLRMYSFGICKSQKEDDWIYLGQFQNMLELSEILSQLYPEMFL